MERWLGLAALILLVVVAAAWWWPEMPAYRSVNDMADLLSKTEKSRITRYHGRLLEDFDIDYRVITVTGANDVDRFAEAQFDQEMIGQVSSEGRGLLLVVDALADQVRLEVGYTLEPIFPDAFVAYIERQQMVPFFRVRRIADGILATTELIVDRADTASRHSEWMQTVQQGSGGGGAKVQAEIDTGPKRINSSVSSAALAPGRTPEGTMAAYVAAMASHNASADLPIYTIETQQMLRNWTVTPAQMDNVVRSYSQCPDNQVRINETKTFAVIRFPIAARKCAPYFLKRVNQAWRLDLAALRDHIQFNHRNQWHLVGEPPAEFAFAFADWTFDAHGYPR